MRTNLGRYLCLTNRLHEQSKSKDYTSRHRLRWPPTALASQHMQMPFWQSWEKNWGQTPINRSALLIQELFAHGLIGLRLLLML